MMKKRIHIKVSGLVHGVNFRHFIFEHAKLLGITGLVRNLTGGWLEIIAEGEEDKLKEILAIAKKGPRLAKVDEIKVDWQAYQGEFSEFRISFF